ncbi:hypothetical protein FB567DRAFT_589584 [Paraphoma chrysanthemicola]|uniref:CorA-like transporter domain-containing protein n=1 Tax=Paraphoma chrysanthemicola TaxID=798071 RepID=A0A8K0RA80_9PLEO|nr:hypothetical protein FB567DRAFT_589584 [Paraphoma chrysanthemicola]
MDLFEVTCSRYENYPLNLPDRSVPKHRMNYYWYKLQNEEERLFDKDERRVSLLTIIGDKMRKKSLCSVEDVQMSLAFSADRLAPATFIFMQAPHSRASLYLSRDMLGYLFTYYEIPPSFLERLFGFGQRVEGRKHNTRPFNNESRMYQIQRGPAIPELNVSGCDLRIHYSVSSVEPSSTSPSLDKSTSSSLNWSVRSTAIYHSFDVETGQVVWVNIKGNRELEDRTLVAVEDSQLRYPIEASAMPCLQATLRTHVAFVDIARENWSLYIDDIETMIDTATARVLVMPVEQVYSTNPTGEEIISRSSPLIPTKASLRSTPSLEKRIGTDSASSDRGQVLMLPPELPPRWDPKSGNTHSRQDRDKETQLLNDFAFGDLQHVEFIEEKLQEMIAVADSNSRALRGLRELYRSFLHHLSQKPEKLASIYDCDRIKEDLGVFELQIGNIEGDLETQRARSKLLVSKIHERKALLRSVLQYRSMTASEFYAHKAQQSAYSMEELTVQMHALAGKTKHEAVSMRIITLVTLFFLPGTFVATFMSTDILRWTDTGRIYQSQALNTYLAISIPLMVVVFVTWAALHNFENRGQRISMPPGFSPFDMKQFRRSMEERLPM